MKLFQEIHQTFSVERKKQRDKTSKSDVSDEIPDEDTDHRPILLKKLMTVSPNGFERLCQRLLRESGFESVTVTGRSGDGGLDGIGVLQVNALVSFKVLFQRKRYSGSVAPSQVRDFRGADGKGRQRNHSHDLYIYI